MIDVSRMGIKDKVAVAARGCIMGGTGSDPPRKLVADAVDKLLELFPNGRFITVKVFQHCDSVGGSVKVEILMPNIGQYVR